MRILFCTPFAERNGAEKLLFYLISHINPDKFTVALYCPQEGPLLSELPSHIPCYYPKKKSVSPEVSHKLTITRKIKRRLINYLFNKRAITQQKPKSYLEQVHEDFKPDIWYINTIYMSSAASMAVELNIPYVVHFHDMLYLYQFISYQDLRAIINTATLLIGCAQCVCDKLTIMGGKNVALQYECTNTNLPGRNVEKINILKQTLNIDPESFVWIMPGAIDYRKGIDRIPALARLLGNKVTIICLGTANSGYGYFIEQELQHYSLGNVIITGFRQEDYYDYLMLADGFVLTSREDPFPLAMIEGASTGKPIVSFNSGGVKEFVKEGMGIVIDSEDIESLSKAMLMIMNREVFLDSSISINRAKEFDILVQVKKWEELMSHKLLV
ncbi:glycosyltransferase family 4 protein [Rhodocytophaga aerolata]|uniref:Glycosyltransferase family 4 protein n=1 Tax=Rhodocytophaga aerolata TaxID=455078 RepID=A0ABT8RIM2_9BACT|nr:glycosyltransferase family 4 protein [Rhodocytophaga aerolata]MDO1451013.1 glycosyltransferase family 4 protein [Rhodocytophaga aerolata]